jgi:hypothetical protein
MERYFIGSSKGMVVIVNKAVNIPNTSGFILLQDEFSSTATSRLWSEPMFAAIRISKTCVDVSLF